MNPFVWDKKTGRYRRPNGTFVSLAEVQQVIDQILDRQIRSAQNLAFQLRNGEISLTVWRQSMRDMIKNVHLYSAAAAKGGWAQLTQADYGRIGNIVRAEYKYLERFARGISDQRIALDGRYFDRVRMYAEAGRDTYYQVTRAAMQAAGMREERNIRTANESCGGCIVESRRGWVPIGKLTPIGRRNCLRKCRCFLEFR